MTRHRNLMMLGLCTAVAACGLTDPSPATAQERSPAMRRLESWLSLLPPDTPSTREVTLSLVLKAMPAAGVVQSAAVVPNRSEIKRGTFVTVCFSSSQHGYVTLWDIDAERNATRIFPNRYTPGGVEENAFAVREGVEDCVATGQDFSLRADGVGGASSLNLFWTPDAASNLSHDQFPNADMLARQLRQESAVGLGLKRATLTFELVD